MNPGVYYNSHVEGTGNILRDATFAAITAQEGATLDMHGNDILPDGEYSVSIGTLFPADGWVSQHLEDNYWGTTDQAQVEAWIRDGNDVSTVYSKVSFLPLRDRTVAVEKRSLGGMKNVFR